MKNSSKETEIRPVAVHTTTIIVKKVVLELLPHATGGGLVFGTTTDSYTGSSSSPLKLLQITDETGLQCAVSPQALVNHFVDSLEIMPGLKVTNIPDSKKLMDLLLENSAVRRKLTFSDQPPQVDLLHGCCYYYTIPTGDVGITFSGFPARVQALSSTGPMAGKAIIPGQTVVAVIIPGQSQPTLTKDSSGFTGTRVTEFLAQNSHIPNRQLVLSQNTLDYTTKHNPASGAGFECNCVVS